MDDKEKFPLDLGAGVSSVPMTGGEELSPQPCTQAKSEFTGDQSAKMPAAGLNGCTPKDSQLTVLKGEEGDDPDYEEHNAKIRARYSANVHKLLGNNPGAVWVDFPECCVRPPGVEFPKPRPRRPDGQIDTAKEEEEKLSGAVVTPPVSA